MALSTFSKFYYGFTITTDNRFINFDEGGGELSASLEVGSYTMDEMRTLIKTALDAVGADTYTVTIDRSTRFFTITSTGTFSLLLATGTQIGSSPFSLLGFTGASDTASAASHVSTSGAGFVFEPQFQLQDYVGKDNFQEKIDSSVNESASGTLEVINFGIRKFTEFSLKFITNIAQDHTVIRNNPSGLADAQAFMQYVTTKAPVEIMEDVGDSDTFEKLVLATTATSRDGTAYKLNELNSRNLPGYYEINRIKFRVFD